MAEPVLEIRNLTKRFGALPASDAVSLTLMPGEIHALIGPNGAGKSTLIRQISGEIRPDSGQVWLGGEDITRLGPAARSRLGLARSFQVSQLLPDYTVLQNLAVAVAGQSRRVFGFLRPVLSDTRLLAPARAAAAEVGLAERENVQVAALSHGERRRLEIALALVMRPRAFLFDEPMAGMGAEGAKALTGLLTGLRQQAPVLLVEHDMDAVFALADRISVLVYGRIIATGTVAEIRANPEVRRSYLGEAA